MKRKTDQYGNLTIAKLAEESDVSGLRIGNKRKIMEKNKYRVGDEEAIENLSTGHGLTAATDKPELKSRVFFVAVSKRL